MGWVTGVNGVTCSLEGARACFKGVLTQTHDNGGQGLLKAKTNLSLTKLCAGRDSPP